MSAPAVQWVPDGDWQGPKGERGAPGADGAAGATGSPGAKGDPGTPGSKGDPGAAGTPGAAGAAGATGAKGDTGVAGPKGDTGAPGPAGAKGDTGSPGTPGATGSAGAAGTAGTAGTAGAKGDTGAKGDQGTSFADAPIVDLPDLPTTAGSPVTINSATAARRRGNLVGDLILNPPSTPVDGRVLELLFAAIGATRIITFVAAIGRMAGYPASLQAPVGKRVRVVLEYDGVLGRWVLLSHNVEG